MYDEQARGVEVLKLFKNALSIICGLDGQVDRATEMKT